MSNPRLFRSAEDVEKLSARNRKAQKRTHEEGLSGANSARCGVMRSGAAASDPDALCAAIAVAGDASQVPSPTVAAAGPIQPQHRNVRNSDGGSVKPHAARNSPLGTRSESLSLPIRKDVAATKSKYRNKKVAKPERDVLRECLSLLAIHPKVAFAYRVNTGGVKFGEQWVKFGTKGQADITGMLKDGRRLEVECKRVGKYPSPEQNAFLYMVNKDGGFAIHVDSVDRLALLLETVET